MLINTYKSKPKLVVKALLFILGITLFAHTITFSTALDDGLVLPESLPGCENPFTELGFSGISTLLQTDGYQFYYDKLDAAPELTGGRYRPLSLITFAIEHQILQSFSPQFEIKSMHAVNVLLYGWLLIIIFQFLMRLSSEKIFISAVITAIFAVLPMHAEVVANIKSRDEILALMLGISSFNFLFQYWKQKSVTFIVLSIGSLFLALLAKENAVIFIVLHPIIFFFQFKEKKIGKLASIAFGLLFLVYFFGIRNYAIQHRAELINNSYQIEEIEFSTTAQDDDGDIFNNPFLLASSSEAFATKLSILGVYFVKQFIPYEMSFDYGYNHMTMQSISSPKTLLSIIGIAGLLLLSLFPFRSKNPLLILIGIGAQLFLASIFLVSNLVFDIGATMGDRLVFQASLGGVMILGFGMQYFKLIKTKKTALLLVGIGVLGYGGMTISRSLDWRSNTSLFLHDVQVVPNSLKANNAAGSSSLKEYYRMDSIAKASSLAQDSIQARAILLKGLSYLIKAEQLYIDPRKGDKYFNYDNYIVKNLINQTYAQFYLRNYSKAESTLAKAKAIKPGSEDIPIYEQLLSDVFYNKGMKAAQENDPKTCLKQFKKAVDYDPNNYSKWYNYGGAAYTYGQFGIALKAFQKALEIKPNDPESMNGLRASQQALSQQ